MYTSDMAAASGSVHVGDATTPPTSRGSDGAHGGREDASMDIVSYAHGVEPQGRETSLGNKTLASDAYVDGHEQESICVVTPPAALRALGSDDANNTVPPDVVGVAQRVPMRTIGDHDQGTSNILQSHVSSSDKCRILTIFI